MQKLKKIYEGKAKQLFETEDENFLIQYFKDDATAFNAQKKAVLDGKGILNNFICEHLMLKLADFGIASHFVKRLNEREQLIRKVKIIPLEIIVRNIVAGSMAKRLGIEEGLKLPDPVFEICFKNDALGDPLINEDHAIKVLKVLNKEQLVKIKKYALKINQILSKIFQKIGIKLVDFKVEFGFDSQSSIILADEISPDSCRLWDCATSKKMDKDRFRRDLGNLVENYHEVALRLGINPGNKFAKKPDYLI
jgi:phosphoribosylaminoimidazole-succinocarboxamide synthase